jgi:hypothetical protein
MFYVHQFFLQEYAILVLSYFLSKFWSLMYKLAHKNIDFNLKSWETFGIFLCIVAN